MAVTNSLGVTVTLSVPDDSTEVEEYTGGFSNTLSFDDLDSSSGFSIISHDLVDDEKKTWLRGMYFIVTGVTYRPGDFEGDYISCEAVLASEQKFNECLKRSQLAELNERFPNQEQTADMLPGWMYPEARVVFNDGSTGIRQQCTAMLVQAGLISVPNYDFSKSFNTWEVLSPAIDVHVKADGEKTLSVNDPRVFSIKCFRGLRVSEYKFDAKLGRAVDGEGQRTYYLS